MAQREVTLQVRFMTDDKKLFPIVDNIMRKATRSVYAQLVVLNGSNPTKPQVQLFADDMIEGNEEVEWQLNQEKLAVPSEQGTGDDPDAL